MRSSFGVLLALLCGVWLSRSSRSSPPQLLATACASCATGASLVAAVALWPTAATTTQPLHRVSSLAACPRSSHTIATVLGCSFEIAEHTSRPISLEQPLWLYSRNDVSMPFPSLVRSNSIAPSRAFGGMAFSCSSSSRSPAAAASDAATFAAISTAALSATTCFAAAFSAAAFCAAAALSAAAVWVLLDPRERMEGKEMVEPPPLVRGRRGWAGRGGFCDEAEEPRPLLLASDDRLGEERPEPGLNEEPPADLKPGRRAGSMDERRPWPPPPLGSAKSDRSLVRVKSGLLITLGCWSADPSTSMNVVPSFSWLIISAESVPSSGGSDVVIVSDAEPVGKVQMAPALSTGKITGRRRGTAGASAQHKRVEEGDGGCASARPRYACPPA